MIKRILSIGDRNAEKEEKAKAWIILLFGVVPAIAGYWVVYRFFTYLFTPRNEGFIELTQSGVYFTTTISIGFLLFAFGLFISAAYARREYRESTYLKEIEKGYVNTSASYSEPEQDLQDVELYDFTIGIGNAEETLYAPVSMTKSQIIAALDSIDLTPHQLSAYEREYKKSKKITAYLKRIKPGVNQRYLNSLGAIKQGDGVMLPL